MNRKTSFILSLFTCLCACLLVACHKVPVGYLDVSAAGFKPKEGYAYKEVDPASNWGKSEQVPFSSTLIQGVSGTEPINYDFAGVKVSGGGDEALFRQCVQDGTVVVRGGRIYLYQSAAKRLPIGRYLISVRVFNDDHSAVVTDAFTFILEQTQPQGEE